MLAAVPARCPTMRTILAAAVLTLVAVAPAAQAAPVSPSQVRIPQVAVNANGRTVVAWERLTNGRFSVEARTGGAPLKLGRIHRLARQGFDPQVAVGADGTAAVMWLESGARGPRSIRVAVARPGHGFGAGQLVERRRANVGPVGVAIQPSGRVVAVWRRSSAALAYALAPRNRAFRDARRLTTIGPITSGSMALDPRDGAVLVAYGTPLTAAPLANQQAGVRTLDRDEAFVASAVPHGPVLLAGVSEPSVGVAPVTADGDGDVQLAAGGSHVLAIYQRDDRLRLKVVR